MTRVRFSSSQYRRADRLEAARDIYAAMANMELAPLSDAPFHLDARLRLLPGVTLARIDCSPLRARRGRSQLADGNDDLMFQINTGGRHDWVSSLHGLGEWRCRPGQGCLVRRDVPGHVASGRPTRGLVGIAFSRATLGPLLERDNPGPGPTPTGPALRLLAAHALAVLDERATGTDTELAAQLHDLAVLVLGGRRDARHNAVAHGLRAARLRAIKADLAAHATRGDLSLAWVARRHGISPAYVRALFERDGGTFTDYLLELRLSRVHRLLGQPAYRHRPVSELALESGFNNLSWFYRAFKRRYGLTPSDRRATG